MAIDLDSIPAETRAQQIKIGRQYGSTDTLAQANHTLSALGTYGDVVAKDGFIAEDTARLEAARDMLIAAGVGRETARTEKKVTNGQHTDALSTGKKLRQRARTILDNTAGALEESVVPNAATTVKAIRATLRHTQTAGVDAEALATQLDQLASTLGADGVKPEADKRGGDEAAIELTEGAVKLRAANADTAVPAGTPAETQLLDHLDGIIVGLARRARKAGRSAGARLGNPAIATAFELEKLYNTPAKKNDKSAPKGNGGNTAPDSPK